MSARRSARISSRGSAPEPTIVHKIQPQALPNTLASDSLVNGVGTVSVAQKRRLSTQLQASAPTPSKSKKGKKLDKAVKEETEDAPFAVPAIPTTPNKRRKPASASVSAPPAPPLTTPTPSAVKLIANNNPNPSTPEKASTPRRRRKVDPHATNAPLQTPGGSRLTSYPSSVFESGSQTPSASQASDNGLTTENLLERACAHLVAVDPRLKTVIEQNHCKMFSPEGLAEEVDPFAALASGIIGQQVSGAAAASIKAKFVALFTRPPSLDEERKYFPTPAQVVAKDIPTLRTAGLSQRKAEYIHGLAEKFVSGELSAKMLIEASDEEVLEKLIAVRGLGRWSVEMFACFGLKRMDIFSTGDLGVQRGMAAYVGRDVAKLKNKGGKWKYMAEEEMLRIASRFAPFRSLFMWYMWRVEDVNLDVMGK